MKPRLYLETTIPSYLATRPSRDVLVLAKQEITRRWWNERRLAFDLFISQEVLNECSAGEVEMAVKRMDFLQGVPRLGSAGADEIGAALRKVYRSRLKPRSILCTSPSPQFTVRSFC